MEKNKKLLIIGGSVGAAALLALIIVSISLANTPKALIVRSIANTLSDARRIEAVAVTEDVANGGSVAVSANLDKFAKDDLTVQGKFYSDAKNLKGALELTASEDKDKVLQAKVMYNPDKVAFSAAPFIDGTYGVDLKKLAKNLPGSIFDPDEETDYSLDDDEFEYFLNMKDTFKNDKNLSRDVEVMANKYRQIFIEKVIKHSEVKKSSKTITVGGDKIPCTVISASIDEDGLAEIVQDMIDYANNDKDLEKLLLRVAANGSYRDDPEEYVDRFFDTLDNYEDSIDKIEDSDIDISIDFYITKSGRRLAQLDFEAELNNKEFEASLILGKNVARSKQISFEYEEKPTGKAYSIEYTVKEDSGKLYDAEIEINEKRVRRSKTTENKSSIRIKWDKRSGDLDIKGNKNGNNYMGLKGTLDKKGDRYIFVLGKLSSRGEAVPDIKSLELTVTIDRHDRTPNVPGRFTEITKMDEKDFEDFIEDFEENAKELWDDYFGK
jgi:hypothetical protein